MIDKEFLKTLTILYVEDDETIRTSLSAILTKIFGEVIICTDGSEGLIQFKNNVLELHKHIDAVVSDINMPNLNGIDMVRGIREIDAEVPVIFTTAHGESNYLMDAIKLKVAHYALKPIDTSDLLKNIADLCMVEHNKKLLAKKSLEIRHYMDIMDNLASIFNIDTAGNIIKVNSLLESISGYSENDLLGMNISKLFHQNSTMKNYNDLKKAIGDQNSYKGKIKFLSNAGATYYLNTTVIASLNDTSNELEGYVLIGFDQTGDELEKQQTMQRVRKNIVEQRSKENELQKQIKTLQEQMKNMQMNSLGDTEAKMILEKLQKEKVKTAKLYNQITHYEEQFKVMEQEKERLTNGSQQRNSSENASKKQSQKEIQRLQTRIIELQATITKLERAAKS